MSLYRPAAVSEQPDVVLTRWQVFEADRGTMHFVGRDVAAEGRVSSRIVSFDPDTMTGRTRSGRVYRLEGPEGHDPDGLYVWQQWKRLNGVKEDRAVGVEGLTARPGGAPDAST